MLFPVTLLIIGVSGAWIGRFMALARYQPLFVAATLLYLAARLHRARPGPRS